MKHAFFIVLLACLCYGQTVVDLKCPYTSHNDMTIHSDDIIKETNEFDYRSCWVTCCNSVGCLASAWNTTDGTCRLFGKIASLEEPSHEKGIILYTVGSTPLYSATGDCKRGNAYDFKNEADIRALNRSIWFYNWYYKPSTNPVVEYVPMVWGGSFDVNTISNAILPGTKYILGFNEPNFHAQANLSPQRAAQLWPQVEQIASRHGLKLVSPAVNYCGPASACWDTNPFTYLSAFFSACSGCKVDYLAVHWYACEESYLANYINQMKQFNKPIWLTEFDCPNAASMGQQDSYMRSALSYLDNEPAVFRYSWFSARANNVDNANLLGGTGQLTSLGQTYNTYNLGNGCH